MLRTPTPQPEQPSRNPQSVHPSGTKAHGQDPIGRPLFLYPDGTVHYEDGQPVGVAGPADPNGPLVSSAPNTVPQPSLAGRNSDKSFNDADGVTHNPDGTVRGYEGTTRPTGTVDNLNGTFTYPDGSLHHADGSPA